MSTFKVVIIREAGTDPVTNEFLDEAQEELTIEAVDEASAYRKSQLMSTLTFRGQIRRTFIDGKEYFGNF